MTSYGKRQIWLITGASSGLGLATAISACRAGHTVLACTRDPWQAAASIPEIEQNGGTWGLLDVAHSNAENVTKHLVEQLGGVDVLVNCAGCLGPLGAMEDISEEAFNQVMNTNFYGPMRTIRGVLSTMRKNRSGTIVQISSTSGIISSPATGPYSTSKFAMEGFSESLAHEVKPFGIRVVLIEPGMFRTSIMHKGHWVTGTACYQEPSAIEVFSWVDAVKAKLGDLDATMGDPSKFGDRIVDIVDKQGLGEDLERYLRVPLGSDAWEMCKQKGSDMVAQSRVTHAIAFSTDSGDAK